jgi:hypothetical protein
VLRGWPQPHQSDNEKTRRFVIDRIDNRDCYKLHSFLSAKGQKQDRTRFSSILKVCVGRHIDPIFPAVIYFFSSHHHFLRMNVFMMVFDAACLFDARLRSGMAASPAVSIAARKISIHNYDQHNSCRCELVRSEILKRSAKQ